MPTPAERLGESGGLGGLGWVPVLCLFAVAGAGLQRQCVGLATKAGRPAAAGGARLPTQPMCLCRSASACMGNTPGILFISICRRRGRASTASPTLPSSASRSARPPACSSECARPQQYDLKLNRVSMLLLSSAPAAAAAAAAVFRSCRRRCCCCRRRGPPPLRHMHCCPAAACPCRPLRQLG